MSPLPLDAQAITPEDLVTVLDLPGHTAIADSERNLLVFKSVGTIIQDLALAQALHNQTSCRSEAKGHR